MKKVFFAILAISMLSTSFAFAGNGKHAKKAVRRKRNALKIARILWDAVIRLR